MRSLDKPETLDPLDLLERLAAAALVVEVEDADAAESSAPRDRRLSPAAPETRP